MLLQNFLHSMMEWRQAGADEGPATGSAGGLSLGGPGVVEFVRDLGGVQVQPCAQPLLEFDDCLMGPRFLWVLAARIFHGSDMEADTVDCVSGGNIS